MSNDINHKFQQEKCQKIKRTEKIDIDLNPNQDNSWLIYNHLNLFFKLI